MSVVKIVFEVPERDIGFFRDRFGRDIKIGYGDKRQKEVTGKITYISELADRMSLTTRMEISIDNTKGRFHSGEILKSVIVRRTVPKAIMIPLRSVIANEKDGRTSHVVYVVEDNDAKRRNVEINLDLLQGNDVHIRTGLASGDRLIIRGQRQVSPGQDVVVMDETPITSSAPAR